MSFPKLLSSAGSMPRRSALLRLGSLPQGALPAAVLLLAIATAACARPEPPIEMLLRGGTIADGAGGSLEAIGIQGGRIAAPADARRTVELTVELDGAHVMPGFVDHHAHLLNIGMSIVNRERGESIYLDLGGMDLDALREGLAARAAAAPGEWVLGKGWSQGNWGASLLPDRTEIDPAVPDSPVLLTRVDGHVGWSNGAALDAAGIDATTPDPEGGAIARDAGGRATGILMERAVEPVTAQLPPVDDDTIRAAFRAGAEALAAQGVVEVFDAGFLSPPGIVDLDRDLARDLELLVAEDRARPLPLSIHLMVPAPSALAEQLVADPDASRQLTPRIDITHIKLFGDGAMGGRGASLSHPFADDPSTDGVVRMTTGQIRDWSARALDAGLDVATHAIGDAAVARALDAYEQLLAERTALDAGRLRIEHFSYASAADIERAARLGVVLSIQPNFVAPDDHGVAMEDARVGDRADTVYAWGSLDRAGAVLAFGSDYFTFPFPPLFTLYAAVTRANLDGLPADGWHPDERLDRTDSLRAMITTHGTGGSVRTMSIAPAEPARLVILDRDPRSATPAEWLDTRVLATIHDGRVVYTDGSLAGLSKPPE